MRQFPTRTARTYRNQRDFGGTPSVSAIKDLMKKSSSMAVSAVDCLEMASRVASHANKPTEELRDHPMVQHHLMGYLAMKARGRLAQRKLMNFFTVLSLGTHPITWNYWIASPHGRG